MNEKLKRYIFNKLYKRLSNAEIIPYNNSIWFIDREERYWYFELENNGTLYWRYGFFPNFFMIFSMERDQFEPIISEWVEEVLNHKVSSTDCNWGIGQWRVEEVLNHKVSTTSLEDFYWRSLVEEVLNHKVSTTAVDGLAKEKKVEEVLNHKVSKIKFFVDRQHHAVEDVLNRKVSKTIGENETVNQLVEEVLNTDPVDSNRDWIVGNILNENPTE